MPSCRICGLPVGVCAHTKHRIQIPDLYEKIATLEGRINDTYTLIKSLTTAVETFQIRLRAQIDINTKTGERLRAIETQLFGKTQ